nr:MAG TPA: hypothetical protein [Crassvirales sp.]
MDVENVLRIILLDVPVIECFIQVIIIAISLRIAKEKLDDEVISTAALNCMLFFIPILGIVMFALLLIRFVHLLMYKYGKEEE